MCVPLALAINPFSRLWRWVTRPQRIAALAREEGLVELLAHTVRSGGSIGSSLRLLGEGAHGRYRRQLQEAANVADEQGLDDIALTMIGRNVLPSESSRLLLLTGMSTGSCAEALTLAAEQIRAQRRMTRQGTNLDRWLFSMALLFAVITGVRNTTMSHFAEIFEGFGIELPIVTKVFFGLAALLSRDGAVYLAVVAAGMLFLKGVVEITQGETTPLARIVGFVWFWLPRRFARPLTLRVASVALSGKQPLTQAFGVLSRHSSSQAVRTQAVRAAHLAEQGLSDWEICRQLRLLRPAEALALSRAQTAGNADWLLRSIAQNCELRNDRLRHAIDRTIDWVFWIFAAGIVLLTVMGLFTPLLQMLNDLS